MNTRISIAAAVAATLMLMPRGLDAQKASGLSQADVTRINDVSQTFAKAVLAADWKTVGSVYVDDATLYPPDEAAVKGRAAIEVCLAALPPMTDFKVRNTSVAGRDDLAYVEGTYTMVFSPPGAPAPVQASGYYLEIRRKQPDGRWLIAVHMLSPHQ